MHWKPLLLLGYWTRSNIVLFCVTVVTIVGIFYSKGNASFPFVKTRISVE